MIQYEIITEEETFYHYKDIWNNLFSSSTAEVSTSFEWTDALLATHLKEKDVFVLIVFRDSKEVVGIAPLIVSKREKMGMSITTLSPVSEYYNTHSDILLKNFSDEMIDVFLKAIFNIKYNWDIFRMGRLVETNPIVSIIGSNLSRIQSNHIIENEEPSFCTTFAGSYKDYLEERSGKFRNYLKRIEKKLQKKGEINVYDYKTFSNISTAYEKLLLVEKNSWKHKHDTAISSVKKQEDFYRKLCDGASKEGRLHLNFLYLNRKPVAYNIGLIKDRKYMYIKTSYDESLKQLSPATLLRAKLIEELIANKITFFDFPGEPYAWEKQWADELQWHKSILIFNQTLKAKIYSHYLALKDKLTWFKKEEKITYHDPRKVKPS